jgi:uncharacterized FlaG/YvyC family protein
MSNQDVRTISAVTGSYPALKVQANTEDKGGKTPATTGKEVPVREQPNMEKLAQKMNLATQTIGRDLRFQVDLEKGSSVIQVLDRETGEIIRQIPPENAKTYVSDFGDVALRLYDAVV